MLSISIAMCTYNGEKYLQEQLDSIAIQSRLPDELIVCDDNSSDMSLSVVERFAKSVVFPVNIFKNQVNVGSTNNFNKAISLCTGEIIALSDQDDVWHIDKLKLIEEVFDNSAKVGAVFSNGNIVNENLSSLGYTLWDKFCFGKNLRNEFENGKSFQVLLNHNVVTGATMAFRSTFRNKILPISPLWFHDAWIALLLSIISDIRFIEKELIEYRQHKDQQIGGLKYTISEQIEISKSVRDYNVQILQYETIARHIKTINLNLECHYMSNISNKITHLNNRQNAYHCNLLLNIIKSINELICVRYHKYSNGYKSFFKDIFTHDS